MLFHLVEAAQGLRPNLLVHCPGGAPCDDEARSHVFEDISHEVDVSHDEVLGSLVVAMVVHGKRILIDVLGTCVSR